MSKKPITPAHAKVLAGNPNTRAALKDKFLNPKQLKQRQLNARLNAPVTPGSSMTARDLAHSRDAAVANRFGAQETVLGQQVAGQQQRGVDQAGWYDAYQKELATHAANTAQQGAQANQANATLLQNVRGLDQGQANQQQASMQADAQNRGATVSPQVGQDASNSSSVRQAMLASFGQQLADHSRASSTYADLLAHVVGPGQKVQAQTQNARQVGALQGQQTALAGQKGAFGQTYADQLVQGEAKNVIASKALGLNEVKAQAQIQNQQQGQARARGRAQRDSARLTLAQQKEAYRQAHPKAPARVKPVRGPGSIPTTAENKIVDQVKQARTLIDSYKGKLTPHQLRVGITQGYLTDGNGKRLSLPKIPLDYFNAGLDLATSGELSPANVKALQNHGLHVAGRFKIGSTKVGKAIGGTTVKLVG